MSSATDVYRARPTDEEIADVLGQRIVAAIGTLNEDGSIHLAYVIFLFEDGRLWFETSSVTRKARNAERRGTASFLVHGTPASGRSVMVAGEGTATVLHGEEAKAVNRRIRTKYITDDAIDLVDRAWNELDDVAIGITPSTWRSWTGATLRTATEESTGTDYESVWRPD
jgi:nitroimidazol reductase NimA-like FMN-containing flavoprotein (pyridoxamine 5'-phosphate oxidase superfamily)